MSDLDFTRCCLELAAQGRGLVGNGALVGAVLVRDGKIIAEAFHEGFGKPHAERALLEKFIGEILPTDTLYVNLEPCCHHGKTPPCTDLIIERGVKRVVYGMKDPDERVAGQGIEKLRAAPARRSLGEGGSCEVIGPVLPAESAWLNRGFVSVRMNDRPWITLKKALMRDGAIAHRDGSPLKITSVEQDRWSHTRLRALHDAILVGSGTILSDDPFLNTRCVQDSPKIYRLILDPSLLIKDDARVLDVTDASPTILLTSDQAGSERRAKLEERGVVVLTVPLDQHGRFVWAELWKALTQPSGTFYGLTSILVEGGRATWAAFEEAGIVDMHVTLTARS